MSSHPRQSPDSPVIHTGLFLCRSLSQQNGRLGGAAPTKVPMKQGGYLQGAHAIPTSCAGLLWWGSSPSSPTGSICFFSPEICYCFWFLSFLQVSWHHSSCHPNHCFQPHDVAMDALYCFKESWEGNKILGTLQIKFLPEQSKQLLEALGYRNWWEASSATQVLPWLRILAQEPKLLHLCTRDVASPAVKEPFIIFFNLKHHPSWWWLSFDSAFWGGCGACPQGVMWLWGWRAAAEPHQCLDSHWVSPAAIKGHGPWLSGGRRCNLCDVFFFHALVFDSSFSS